MVFCSSRAASTSSRTTNGEGFVAMTAERRAIDVRARSPPERAFRDLSFLPGGVAWISIPVMASWRFLTRSAMDFSSGSDSV